jgi:two-component system, chemotaxis family, sensor kinase Cph1
MDMSEAATGHGSARTRNIARGDLAVHDHICGLYDTREQKYEPARQFLKVGLERRERCLYISEQRTPAEFLGYLAAHGIDVPQATARGALKVVSGKEMRLTLGGFTPDSMMSFLASAEADALNAGFVGLRWAADMNWLRKDDIAPIDLFTFESRLNDFLPHHQIAGLCQYTMDDFEAELLIAAAETHPSLAYNEVVCDNYYYIPPEEYLKPAFPELKLKRILFNMITRERLMDRFLSTSRP